MESRAGKCRRTGTSLSSLVRLRSGNLGGRPLGSHRADEFVSAVRTDAVGDERRSCPKLRRHVISWKGDAAPGTHPDPGRRGRGVGGYHSFPHLGGSCRAYWYCPAGVGGYFDSLSFLPGEGQEDNLRTVHFLLCTSWISLWISCGIDVETPDGGIPTGLAWSGRKRDTGQC